MSKSGVVPGKPEAADLNRDWRCGSGTEDGPPLYRAPSPLAVGLYSLLHLKLYLVIVAATNCHHHIKIFGLGWCT